MRHNVVVTVVDDSGEKGSPEPLMAVEGEEEDGWAEAGDVQEPQIVDPPPPVVEALELRISLDLGKLRRVAHRKGQEKLPRRIRVLGVPWRYTLASAYFLLLCADDLLICVCRMKRKLGLRVFNAS